MNDRRVVVALAIVAIEFILCVNMLMPMGGNMAAIAVVLAGGSFCILFVSFGALVNSMEDDEMTDNRLVRSWLWFCLIGLALNGLYAVSLKAYAEAVVAGVGVLALFMLLRAGRGTK